jgi:hypothetical protein
MVGLEGFGCFASKSTACLEDAGSKRCSCTAGFFFEKASMAQAQNARVEMQSVSDNGTGTSYDDNTRYLARWRVHRTILYGYCAETVPVHLTHLSCSKHAGCRRLVLHSSLSQPRQCCVKVLRKSINTNSPTDTVLRLRLQDCSTYTSITNTNRRNLVHVHRSIPRSAHRAHRKVHGQIWHATLHA